MTKRRNILFDNGVPRPLRRRLQPHRIITTQELGWEQLKNGELLRAAEADFDVLITTDSNIKYQQSLPARDIALIVLRAFRISMKYYEPLLPQILETLETIEPGQAVYIYADTELAQKDQRKGRR
jgi:predicted nuclease of predicted toxin-antitoxin system